jgi:adenine-specific DNA-methyltransferase
VDVFDPTTGAVRTGGTDDIACWFIDSDYDGQSFFVRHAYFLYGGKGTSDGPYDKLMKALRAEIDEGEWSTLYSATSQPFDLPKSGKIAVKVINHYGDEVLSRWFDPTRRYLAPFSISGRICQVPPKDPLLPFAISFTDRT